MRESVAVWCTVLQCVAVCCSAHTWGLIHERECYSMMQCIAVLTHEACCARERERACAQVRESKQERDRLRKVPTLGLSHM